MDHDGVKQVFPSVVPYGGISTWDSPYMTGYPNYYNIVPFGGKITNPGIDGLQAYGKYMISGLQTYSKYMFDAFQTNGKYTINGLQTNGKYMISGLQTHGSTCSVDFRYMVRT